MKNGTDLIIGVGVTHKKISPSQNLIPSNPEFCPFPPPPPLTLYPNTFLARPTSTFCSFHSNKKVQGQINILQNIPKKCRLGLVIQQFIYKDQSKNVYFGSKTMNLVCYILCAQVGLISGLRAWGFHVLMKTRPGETLQYSIASYITSELRFRPRVVRSVPRASDTRFGSVSAALQYRINCSQKNHRTAQ